MPIANTRELHTSYLVMLHVCVAARLSVDGISLADRHQLRDKYPLCLYRISSDIPVVMLISCRSECSDVHQKYFSVSLMTDYQTGTRNWSLFKSAVFAGHVIAPNESFVPLGLKCAWQCMAVLWRECIPGRKWARDLSLACKNICMVFSQM